MMKNVIRGAVIGFGLALALAACGTVKNPLQPSMVYNLENAYGIVQSSAVAYDKLPRCSATQTILCSKAAVVVSLAKYDGEARTALSALEAFVRNPANYPGLSYSQLLSTAQTAISTFQAIEAQNGVGK